MKHDSHRTPFRRTAVLLAALLLTGPLAAGCSLGKISEMAKEFKEEYAPNSTVSGTVVDAPPPSSTHKDDGSGDKPEGTDPAGSEDGKPETENPDKTDPAEGENSGRTEEEGEPAAAREVTLQSVTAANRMSMLVSRYGCIVTEQPTTDGPRKAYNYEADTPGGRASIEFVDMRGTPSGCFGHIRTADGTWLYISAADFENASSSVTLTEEDAPSGPSVSLEPFAAFSGGSLRVLERGQTEILVHCESADGGTRGDFTLSASSLELKHASYVYENGSALEITYTYGGDRFGADRITAALTDYYSVDPSSLTFTLDDMRAANSLTALLGAYGQAGYELKWETGAQESEGLRAEKASAYTSDGHRIIVRTETKDDGSASTRILCDGLLLPEANGIARVYCGVQDSGENLISGLIPDGVIGSVTESGSSVVLIVRFMRSGSPAVARLIADRQSLLLSSCEVDLVGDGASRRLYTVSFEKGGEKEAAERTAALGTGRKAVYHVEWANAPAEDYTYTIPGNWSFRLLFWSDAEFYYDSEHLGKTSAQIQVPADGMDYEIWVTGATKYTDGDGTPVSDAFLADLTAANRLSSLVGRYGSVTEQNGAEVTAFRKDGSLWVRYRKDESEETGEYGPVRMSVGEDGWITCIASYGDIVRNPDEEYQYEQVFGDTIRALAAEGTLRELIPVGGGNTDRERHFLLLRENGSYTRLTVLRESLALVRIRTYRDDALVSERTYSTGAFIDGDYMVPWEQIRTASFHILNEGAEVASIRVKIPVGASFRIEMPAGWDWFFSDARLTTLVPLWAQVSAGVENTELWVDNRDPATRPPVEAEEPEEPVSPFLPEQPGGESGEDGDGGYWDGFPIGTWD
jgi:hypothetical protein